jgi:hypothetical protein
MKFNPYRLISKQINPLKMIHSLKFLDVEIKEEGEQRPLPPSSRKGRQLVLFRDLIE